MPTPTERLAARLDQLRADDATALRHLTDLLTVTADPDAPDYDTALDAELDAAIARSVIAGRIQAVHAAVRYVATGGDPGDPAALLRYLTRRCPVGTGTSAAARRTGYGMEALTLPGVVGGDSPPPPAAVTRPTDIPVRLLEGARP